LEGVERLRMSLKRFISMISTCLIQVCRQ
jgi:hypothetical protein